MGTRPDARYLLAAGLLGFVLGAFFVSTAGLATALARRAARPAVADVMGGVDDAGSPVVEAPAATAGRTDAAPAAEAKELADRGLDVPVDGVTRDKLVRSFRDARSGHEHEALDILAPRNTPVRAVEDGTIAKLFLSKAGGNTIYQFDPGERYCYYYAHLERYADGLKEGDHVGKGQVIGYVGTSGNAPTDTPHLHFAVFRLTPEKHWWEGTAIDPYDVLR